MAEYIERTEALEITTRTCGDYAAAWSEIRKLPAADVVPVVRCKDCERYEMGVCLKIYSDGNVNTDAWQPRRPEDFCSYGERKDSSDGCWGVKAMPQLWRGDG